ncbi:MAG TPA: protein phosphatase 2C domain-containing protein [Gemmatimonadales bacterium]|nr:protein phosphatase 2C domain-containing protein [Gemmatimonadales bacterium]
MTQSFAEAAAPPAHKPADDEVDVYGLTHTGKVRKTNQDHFLIGSLRKHMQVHLTSLPTIDQLSDPGDRLAFLAMVADGVGGGAGGETASRLAVEVVTRYVSQSVQCYYASGGADDTFLTALQDAAMQSHADILAMADAHPELAGMATTLTLWIGVWPRAYLLQVGDSRCYLLRNGELTQLSRDQTMAQELIDAGVLARAEASRTRWAHTLSSAIGGRQTAPIVTRLEQQWGNVGLLCSDGLTAHVSDERIRERLRTMTSARQVCEDLLQDALDGGGTDNITILVGRTIGKRAAE